MVPMILMVPTVPTVPMVPMVFAIPKWFAPAQSTLVDWIILLGAVALALVGVGTLMVKVIRPVRSGGQRLGRYLQREITEPLRAEVKRVDDRVSTLAVSQMKHATEQSSVASEVRALIAAFDEHRTYVYMHLGDPTEKGAPMIDRIERIEASGGRVEEQLLGERLSRHDR